MVITADPIGPGDPLPRTVYYVAEGDANKAEAIIANTLAPNEKGEAYGVLPEAAVEALGLNRVSSSPHDRVPEVPGSFHHGDAVFNIKQTCK